MNLIKLKIIFRHFARAKWCHNYNMDKSNILFIEIHNVQSQDISDKVAACFSIECPSGSEANCLILEGKGGGKKWYDAK